MKAEEDIGVRIAGEDRGEKTAEEGQGGMTAGMKRMGAGTPGRAGMGGATERGTDPGAVAIPQGRPVAIEIKRCSAMRKTSVLKFVEVEDQ